MWAYETIIFMSVCYNMKTVIWMKTERFISSDVKETIAFGSEFAKKIETGKTVFLQGVLGAGKTAFAKGVAKGLGIDDVVNSPTFTILKEYQGRLKLVHVDAYRLEGVDSDSLGLYDLMLPENLVLIEWGEFLEDLDINFDYHIRITIREDESRLIEVKEC